MQNQSSTLCVVDVQLGNAQLQTCVQHANVSVPKHPVYLRSALLPLFVHIENVRERWDCNRNQNCSHAVVIRRLETSLLRQGFGWSVRAVCCTQSRPQGEVAKKKNIRHYWLELIYCQLSLETIAVVTVVKFRWFLARWTSESFHSHCVGLMRHVLESWQRRPWL